MSADDVANGLIKGIKKNRFLIIPGFDGKLAYYFKRFFPWIVEMVMDMTIRKTQKKRSP